MTHRGEERPIELGDVPAEEEISTADAAERLEQDPEEQVNKPDQEDPASGDDVSGDAGRR